MKKVKLTNEEKFIEDHAEEFIPASRAEFNEIAQAVAAMKKRILKQETIIPNRKNYEKT